MNLRQDAWQIIRTAIHDAQPAEAVRRAMDNLTFGSGAILPVAIGKAAWPMAKAACDHLGSRVRDGIVITKYHHSQGAIGPLRIREAGHPVPDVNAFAATAQAMEQVENLSAGDTVLFLISGGGSALFEQPLIPAADLERLTGELLACGADIIEMNTIRKRFSAVKGGRFAALCAPAQVQAVILSDVVGDRLDMIASGPACPDSTTAQDAAAIAEKYHLTTTPQMTELLYTETPKVLHNVSTTITGSVRQLCRSAERVCRELGYTPIMLTDCLCCTARDAGVFLSNIARSHADNGQKLAFLAGGETVVHLTGSGLGGRNQELALAAAPGLAGLSNTAVFSFGSDGTDGPTDAAGGYADGETLGALRNAGLDVFTVLQNNDAYHALEAVDGLIKTGPTGTNVNDLAVLRIG